MKGKYDDIINLTRPPSKKPKMDMLDRAAQFSPFAALTGHEDAIKERGRLTEKRLELDQELKEDISRKLAFLKDKIEEKPEVFIEYFQKDITKEGGEYIKKKDRLIKIDLYRKKIFFAGGEEIAFDDIYQIDFMGSLI